MFGVVFGRVGRDFALGTVGRRGECELVEVGVNVVSPYVAVACYGVSCPFVLYGLALVT